MPVRLFSTQIAKCRKPGFLRFGAAPYIALCAGLLLPGCVSTVKNVVSAPIKVASKTADVLTTSQSEADENRGRALRLKERKLGQLARRLERAAAACKKGDDRACADAEDYRRQIEAEENRDI